MAISGFGYIDDTTTGFGLMGVFESKKNIEID